MAPILSTREFLDAEHQARPDHLALFLERFLEDHGSPASGEPGEKQVHMDRCTRLAAPPVYFPAFERWKNSCQAAAFQTAVFQSTSPMVVGLGTGSALETSIRLHRTYGVPLLPGTALKGVASKAFGKGDPVNKQGHDEIFGDTALSGCVIFHDAWLVPEKDKPLLIRDIMTTHHPEYYTGKDGAPPADYDDPTPIPFVSVRPNSKFLVALEFHPSAAAYGMAAMKALEWALEHEGIGAKTSSGYGRLLRAEPKHG